MLQNYSPSSAADAAGTFVRYAFRFAGTLVFASLLLGGYWAYGLVPRSEASAVPFRFTDRDLAHLPTHGAVHSGILTGRSAGRHYGNLPTRDRDFSAFLTQTDGDVKLRNFESEIRRTPVLGEARVVLSNRYHDLETRFGPVRAAEMHVDVDGFRKICLAFLSRFETPYVYLKGWQCEASGARPSPVGLACMLNTLVLDSDLSSREANRFVRDRLKRGNSCSASPVTQTVDTRPARPPNYRR